MDSLAISLTYLLLQALVFFFYLVSAGQVRFLLVPTTFGCNPYLMHQPPGSSPKKLFQICKIQTNLKKFHVHTSTEQ